MQFIRAFVVSILILALSIPVPALAASPITTYQHGPFTLTADKSTKRITIKEGSVVVGYIDFNTNKSYTYKIDGSVLEEDINAVILAYAGGSAANASHISTSIRNMVETNPPRRLHSQATTDPMPCHLSPCPPGSNPGPNPWTTPLPNDFGPFYDNTGPIGDGPTWGDMMAMDYEDWQDWRSEQCSSAANTGGLAAAGAIAAGAGCATVVTGVGLIACGIGLVLVAWQASEGAEAANNCARPYPGYRGW